MLEDHFCDGRPPFEQVGAQVVKDVVAYENIKLRVLNASHSSLCYLAALAGFDMVHDVVQTPLFRGFLNKMLAFEVEPYLHAPSDVNLNQYSMSVIQRFSNPALGDQVARLCLDGSGKMPKFILPSVQAQLDSSEPHIELLTLAIAGWMRFLAGTDDKGNTLKIEDPLVAKLHPVAVQAVKAKNPASLLAIMATIFDAHLVNHPLFAQHITKHFQALCNNGAMHTLQATLKQLPSRL